MKVAIIGAGNIAEVHAKAIRSLGHEIEVVVGKGESAKTFASRFGIATYASSLEDAMAVDFQIAHICTPPALHYEQIKKLLLAAKHVISEKPFTLDIAQAKELAKLAEGQNLVNAVCFNNRFYAATKRAKALLMGEQMNLAFGSYLQSFHLLPTQYSWRYEETLAGKMRAVTEIASHWLDLLYYLTQRKISHVSALFQAQHPKRYLHEGLMYAEYPSGKVMEVPSEDSALIQARLSKGGLASLVVSETIHGKQNALSIHVSTGNKQIHWNAENPYILNIADKNGQAQECFAFGGGFAESFSALIEEVYVSINQKDCDKTFADFAQAGYNVAVCEAIYKSAMQDGKFVEVQF